MKFVWHFIAEFERSKAEHEVGDGPSAGRIFGAKAALEARVKDLRSEIPKMTGSVRDMEILAELAYFNTWVSQKSLERM